MDSLRIRGSDGRPVEVSSGEPMPVVGAPGTPVNLSGTITVGGTAQALAAVSATRIALVVCNPNAVNDLWVAHNGVTAVPNGQGSFRVAANGGMVTFRIGEDPVRTAFSIYGAVTGQAFTASEV